MTVADRRTGRLFLLAATLLFGCIATVVVWRKLVSNSQQPVNGAPGTGQAEVPAPATR